MKAYGIPVQSFVSKQPTSSASGSLIGAYVKTDSSASGTVLRAAQSSSPVTVVTTASVESSIASVKSPALIKSEVDDCHLTSKHLELEFMDDDFHGPVSSGDPMLSSPHLSPHGIMPSPVSSGSLYSANDDALTPDSMDMAV
jgi:hypothetical protein